MVKKIYLGTACEGMVGRDEARKAKAGLGNPSPGLGKPSPELVPDCLIGNLWVTNLASETDCVKSLYAIRLLTGVRQSVSVIRPSVSCFSILKNLETVGRIVEAIRLIAFLFGNNLLAFRGKR